MRSQRFVTDIQETSDKIGKINTDQNQNCEQGDQKTWFLLEEFS